MATGFYFPTAIPPASILLVKSNNPFGRAVRCVTRSRWNHAALLTYPQTKNVEDMGTLEAHDLRGVRSLTIQHYVDDPQVETLGVFRVEPTLPLVERSRVIETAQAMTGKPYDLSQIFWIYFSLWLPLPRNTARWDSPNELICSELIARAYRAIGIDLCPSRVPVGQLTPGHLEKSLFKIWEGSRVVGPAVSVKPDEGSDR